jgi:hypothetical protein
MKYWFILLALLLPGCGDTTTEATGINYKDVRIFMHEPNHYSILYPCCGQLKQYQFYNCTATFLTDLEEDQKPWVEGTQTRYIYGGGGSRTVNDLTFHVHDATEVNGAGFNRRVSKNTVVQGQVEVVE